MSKIITVTQEHIDNGTVKECTKCPIALAISELYGYDIEDERVEVDQGVVLVIDARDLFTTRYVLPKEADLFIERFDGGEHVDPFTFEMEEYEYDGG